MKPIVIFITLSSFLTAGWAGDIASVNFKAIKDDLREVYFSKPENEEIKREFERVSEEENKRRDEAQKSIAAGQFFVDIGKMIPKAGEMNRFELERKIDSDLKKELYQIISGLGLHYDFIYDSSATEAIIYSSSQVDDITVPVRQAFLDAAKK